MSLSRRLAPLALLALSACFMKEEARLVTGAEGSMGDAVEGNNAFAFDVLAQMGDVEGNLFFSPFSIYSALSMTLAATEGDTEAQMRDVLHVPDDEPAFHADMGALTTDLSGDHGRPYELLVANALFGQDGFPFSADYLALTEESYGAPLQPMDFAGDPEGSREAINDWVADGTRGRIEDLLPPDAIDGQTILVLANAVYFLADWQTTFDRGDTEDGSFFLADGDEVTAEVMHGEVDAGIARVDGVGVLRLPYAGGDLSMFVLLPEAPDGLPALEAALDTKLLAQMAAETLYEREVDVTLPKFEMTLRTDLPAVLAGLGMTLPFECGAADFSGMAAPEDAAGLCITGAFHEAYVRVDESGTEAAAGTAVVVGKGTAIEVDAFVADHPFLFLVRDDLTGTVLFVGRVADPR